MPISIAKGYEAGLQSRRAEAAAKTTEAFKGLQMEEIRSKMRARKTESVRAAELNKGYGYLSGGELEKARDVAKGLGKVGRDLSLAVREQQEFTEEEAMERFQMAHKVLTGLPEEQRQSFQRGMVADFSDQYDQSGNLVRKGAITDAEAAQLWDMDTATFGRVADKIAGVKTKLPTGDYVVYENPDNPNETKNVNEASAKGQKFLADNPDWRPAPKREELRTGPLSGAKADDLRARLDANKGARKQIAFAINALRENRARGGFIGQIRKTTQSFISAMRDFSTVTGVQIGDDLANGLADSDIWQFFDKTLPDLQIIENSLAYAVARQRKPNKTLNAQDVQLAKDDTQIMGLTDTDSVIERLTFLDGLIGEDSKSVRGRLGIEAPSLPRYRMGKDGKLEKVE